MNLGAWFCRLLFRWSDQRDVHGIRVGVDGDTEAERRAAFARVEAAIALIRRYDARRWARFRRDVDRVLVFGTVGAVGQWYPQLRMVRLQAVYLLSESTSELEVASTLVHEGAHAWLSHLGFGYPEHLRARIEAVCFRSELAFARRLPDPGDLLVRARRQLARDPSFWSTEAFSDRAAADLRQLGAPAWLVAFLRGFARWRHAAQCGYARVLGGVRAGRLTR